MSEVLSKKWLVLSHYLIDNQIQGRSLGWSTTSTYTHCRLTTAKWQMITRLRTNDQDTFWTNDDRLFDHWPECMLAARRCRCCCCCCRYGGSTITSTNRVCRISWACFPKYRPDWKLSHVSDSVLDIAEIKGSVPPCDIGLDHVLNALDISCHLSVNFWPPAWQLSYDRLPFLMSFFKKCAHRVKGFLRRLPSRSTRGNHAEGRIVILYTVRYESYHNHNHVLPLLFCRIKYHWHCRVTSVSDNHWNSFFELTVRQSPHQDVPTFGSQDSQTPHQVVGYHEQIPLDDTKVWHQTIISEYEASLRCLEYCSTSNAWHGGSRHLCSLS